MRSVPYPPWPVCDEQEEEALIRVARSRRWGGAPYPGPETSTFLDEFLAAQGGEHAIACSNGTVTMEIALRAAEIGWGDEVIVPAYTFQATAVAVLAAGATPVLVDIDPETYCLDPGSAEAAITSNTRAIMVVHVGHEMGDMDAVCALAQAHDVVVIEDCAHSHGAKWRGRGAGSLSDFGSFSLQSSKLLTTGEGGVLVCRNAALAQRAASLANNGRPYLPGGRRAGGDCYTMGTNMRMTEFQSALGRVGLERLLQQTQARSLAADQLDDELAGWPGLRTLVRDPRHTQRSVFCYVFAMDASVWGFDRDLLCGLLESEGIPCWGGYRPLHRDLLYQPSRSRLPLARTSPDLVHFDAVALPRAEQAGREAIWLYERVFRDGERGIHDVVAALRKLYELREEIVSQRHECERRVAASQ